MTSVLRHGLVLIVLMLLASHQTASAKPLRIQSDEANGGNGEGLVRLAREPDYFQSIGLDQSWMGGSSYDTDDYDDDFGYAFR